MGMIFICVPLQSIHDTKFLIVTFYLMTVFKPLAERERKDIWEKGHFKSVNYRCPKNYKLSLS